MFLLGLPRVPEVLQEQTGQVTCPIFFFSMAATGTSGQKASSKSFTRLGRRLILCKQCGLE